VNLKGSLVWTFVKVRQSPDSELNIYIYHWIYTDICTVQFAGHSEFMCLFI